MASRRTEHVFETHVVEPDRAKRVISVITEGADLPNTKVVGGFQITGPVRKGKRATSLAAGAAKHTVIVVTAKGPANSDALLEVVDRLDQQAIQHEEAAEHIIEALTPEPATLSPGQVAQLARSAEVFTMIEREFGFFTGPQVGELAGSTAANRSATAARWRMQGRVFAISRAGVFYFPSFQFGPDGQPKEVVARVITAFGAAGDHGWALGSWFVAVNGYLANDSTGGRRPVDVMDQDADSLVEAAQAATEGGP